jgi:hypothetical protein
MYVLIRIHLNRCRHRVNNNQIRPDPTELVIHEHRQAISASPADITLY